MTKTPITYAERRALIDPVAYDLERIAHRISQGAISDEKAISELRRIADFMEQVTS